MGTNLIGRTVGDFLVESLLGEGSMARVFRATQVALRRPVALKVLEPSLLTPDESLTRFQREAEVAARLEHPNIVPVYGSGQAGNLYFIAMRLVEGGTLADAIQEGIPLARALDWAAKLARALHYAHEQGVIHRDLKPSNILVAAGEPLLSDFGLARILGESTITASGALLGTPLYMAPEQAARQRVSVASDVFSIGAMLYEMATGKNPFVAEALPTGESRSVQRAALMDRVARCVFPPPRTIRPDLPEPVEAVILRAMAKEPEARYASAGEFAVAIERAARGESLPPAISRNAPPPPSSVVKTPPSPPTVTDAFAATVKVGEEADDGVPKPGTRFGRFWIERVLGRGGMGIVYCAKDTQLDRKVALKVHLGGANASPQQARRFEREARAAARLSHPSIVRILEVGDVDGQPFFTMDLVDGDSLSDVIQQRRRFAPLGAVQVVRDVAEALSYAHAQGVVHRDMKPSNILVDRKTSKVYVTDLGLAKILEDEQDLKKSWETRLTESGMLLGTPAYMAPEQAKGDVDHIDARTDVYGLGAVMYELLTGEPPHSGPSAMQTAFSVVYNEPAAPRKKVPEIPQDVEVVCLRALDKSPAGRYQSIQAMKEDLDRILLGQKVLAKAPSAFAKWWDRVCRRPGVLAGILAVVTVVVVAACWPLISRMLPEGGPSGFAKQKMVDNEMQAMTTLKNLAVHMEVLRCDDRDCDEMNAFWTRDVAGLFAHRPKGSTEAMQAIDIQLAQADPVGFPRYPGSFKDSKPQPHYGYWFVMVERDVDGKPLAQDLNGDGLAAENMERFAICAYPEEYQSTGTRTFVINEEGIPWWKNTGGDPVQGYPGPDPSAEGWNTQ